MSQTKSSTHSFIIRIWREENGRPSWRGHITHVPSGERRFINRHVQLLTFINTYLEEMDVARGTIVSSETTIERDEEFKVWLLLLTD